MYEDSIRKPNGNYWKISRRGDEGKRTIEGVKLIKVHYMHVLCEISQ
jgi:hypothetical protein